jgi:hypothetical protein
VTCHSTVGGQGIVLRTPKPGQRFVNRNIDGNILKSFGSLLALYFGTSSGGNSIPKT